MAAQAIEILTTLLTLAGLAYLAITLRAARAFTRYWQTRPREVQDAPTISILKPMKGLDPGMVPALESHCNQQYAGRYEIIFGVSSLDDPAVPYLEQLKAAHPTLPIRIVHCTERLGASGKVSNLTQMLPHALGEIVVVNDSDIHVSPHYLSHIAAGFTANAPSVTAKSPANTVSSTVKPPVGMVTMPYIGRCSKPATLWAKLESLGISTDFFPSVLTARMLEKGIRFGLGGTLAMRRQAIDSIGGFAPLVDHLADDYELGARIAAAGYSVELYPEVVETITPRYDLAGFAHHQLRWLRTVRDSRGAGYFGISTTYAVPWALATCVASGGALWSFTLLSIALLARVAVALTVGVGVLRDEQVLQNLWLIPARDCVALALWFWSYSSDTILWRGERFTLKDGRLRPAKP